MTIRDLMEQGIKLQGNIAVNRIDGDEMTTILDSYSLDNTIGENIRTEVLDLEIRYIYADGDDLVIEVIEEEER